MILIAFLAAIAAGLLGFLAPMLGGEASAKLTSFKVAAGLFAGAAVVLAADWLSHRPG